MNRASDADPRSASASEIQPAPIKQRPLVYVVDDDRPARESVRALVHSMGLDCQTYPSAEQFLDEYQSGPGCVVTDQCLKGMSGADLQQELIRRNLFVPLIVVTAFAETSTTVELVRNGAVAVLEKPFSSEDLWKAIRLSLELDAEFRAHHELSAEYRRRLVTLTDAERDVLTFVIDGHSNKQIAHLLNVSLRTVENRRASVFAKTRTQSVAELIQFTYLAEGVDSPVRAVMERIQRNNDQQAPD